MGMVSANQGFVKEAMKERIDTAMNYGLGKWYIGILLMKSFIGILRLVLVVQNQLITI